MPAPDRLLTGLDSGLERTLILLSRAAADSKSAMRWPVLSTQAKSGGGSGRVVVLRRFDREAHICSIWTDARSTKVRELRAAPQAALLFFDPAKKLQIRASGTMTIHKDGAEHRAALERAEQVSLDDYATIAGPGAMIESPDVALNTDDARAHFTLLTLQIEALDVLELSRSGHRRARFEWRDNTLKASWRVP